MGFKRGLIVGFGVGYVLGAKAGKERYEELREAWDRFMGNPTVRSVVERGREVVESGAQKSLHVVEEGVRKASGTVKQKLDGEEEEGWEPVKKS